MGDQWEARVSAMENIQEKLEHNIREMEGQLARLTSLFKDMAVRPRGPSPLPNQQVPRPLIRVYNIYVLPLYTWCFCIVYHHFVHFYVCYLFSGDIQG